MKHSLALLTFTLLSACAHVTILRPIEPRVEPPTESHRVHMASYFWGLLPGEALHEDRLCPGVRIETVELAMNTGDALLSLVTLGIYVPHHADVSCAQ